MSALFLEKVSYEEMLSYKFETEDYTVQATVFGNGVKVMMNFCETEYAVPGTVAIVPSHEFVVFEKRKMWKERKSSQF